MLLVIDVGNTNIVLGIFKGKELMDHWRVSTNRLRTTDEYGVLIRNLFYLNGVNSDEIDAIIISSVVPPVMPTLERMCQRYFGLTPLVIAGGTAMYNAEPIADFIDLVSLGEGEDITVELVELHRKARREGWSKMQFLRAAAQLPGIYVPSLYEVTYHDDGTVAEILPGLAVIDCGGVGYACMTTNNTLSQLKKGEKKKLYTYLNVGESIFDLYGFATQNELNSFKLLLGVSGVGPKAALAILSANTPEGLAMAIVTEDAKSLTAAQGIGKKIAQRIILELKDKMAKETASGLDFSGGKGAAVPAVFTSKATEAAAALAVLGYSTQEVQMALKGVDVENLPLEEIIRQGLKKMVK